MGRGYTQEWDDDERDEETEGGEEPQDELAELDEETRARVEARIAREKSETLAAHTASQREVLQSAGFDVSPDGRPLIGDPQKVREFVLGLSPQPAPQPTSGQPVEDEEDIPDSVTDPAGFRAWLANDRKKIAQEVLASLQPRLDQTDEWRVSVAEKQALERVEQLLPGTAMSNLISQENREKFRKAFTGALKTTPSEMWSNDLFLEGVAGWTIPQVFPRGEQGRDAKTGRYTSEQSRNAYLYQESHIAHPDGQRAPRNPPLPDDEAKAAAAFRMTPEQYRAYSKPGMTIDDHRAIKAAAAAKGKK